MKTNFPGALLLMLALLVSVNFLFAQGAATQLKVGDKAPVVEGRVENGKTWKLSKDIGKKVVLLYFYPKDDTPGCTKEACGFRDRIADLKKSNVDVIGVSFDTEASHQQFVEKYKLNFPLIADTDGKIADAYGARKPGKTTDDRISFLIGLDGKVAHITKSGNPDIHLSEMQQAVNDLKKN
jgi:peroxiredoxin Q/BCP